MELNQRLFLVFWVIAGLTTISFAQSESDTIEIAILEFLYEDDLDLKIEEKILIPIIDRNLHLCNVSGIKFKKTRIRKGLLREFRYVVPDRKLHFVSTDL